jgi:hypothetical protein
VPTSRTTRTVATVLALVLTPIGAIAAPHPAAAAPVPPWLRDVRPSGPAPASPPVEPARSAPPGKNAPASTPAVRLPATGSRVVSVGRQQDAAAVDGLAVAAREETPTGARVRVQTLGRVAGATGFAFRLSNADGAEALPVRVSVDYSGFADAYGGGYAERLKVVALPSGARLPARNDAAATPLTG